METDDLVHQTEDLVRDFADALTTPRPGECLLCFVHRQLTEFGCDTTLRFARRFRDLTAPRATGLERRLGSVGGYCDCEIMLNDYTLVDRWWVPEKEDETADGTIITDADLPDVYPDCRTVRRSSTQGCALWVRWRRYGW